MRHAKTPAALPGVTGAGIKGSLDSAPDTTFSVGHQSSGGDALADLLDQMPVAAPISADRIRDTDRRLDEIERRLSRKKRGRA